MFKISPVSIDGFSPNFCHWSILGQDELIRFWGQKVGGQGYIIAAETSSTDSAVELCPVLEK